MASPAEDLPGLLRQWSEARLAELGALERPVEPAASTGSLLRPPATEDAVTAVEHRLGLRFPPSYRQFLLLSDGAYGDTLGAVTAARAGIVGVPWGFLPVAEVQRLIDVEPETVELWAPLEDDEHSAWDGDPDSTGAYEGAEIEDESPMRDALLISRGVDANCSLLVPVGVAGPGEEWEVWDRHREGGTRWSSFRAHVRETVEDHLGVDVDEAEARLLLAAAESGDQQAVVRLGRVRSPAATELLLDAARRGVLPHVVMRALARIGGPRVVAALTEVRFDAPWDQDHAHLALARIGTPEALDHLVDAGACYELAHVGDPRAAEVARAQLRSSDHRARGVAGHVLFQLGERG